MKYSVICVALSAMVGYVGGTLFGLTGLFLTVPVAFFLGGLGAYLDNR